MTADEAVEVFERAVEGGLLDDLRTDWGGILARSVDEDIVDALLYNRFLIQPREGVGFGAFEKIAGNPSWRRRGRR